MWLNYSNSASLLELSPHWAACCLLQQALMCWSVLSWVFGATALLSYPGSVPLNPSRPFLRPQSSKSPFLYLYPSHSSFFRFSPYPLLMTWRSRCTPAFACLWSETAGITLFPFPREHSWGAPLLLENCLRISITLPSLEQKKLCQALLPEHSLLSWYYDAWIHWQSLPLLGSSYFFSITWAVNPPKLSLLIFHNPLEHHWPSNKTTSNHASSMGLNYTLPGGYTT